jgi:hypothetical protein
MARYDREYFNKQFEGLSPKAMAVIALRAAVRVFPVLAQRRDATGEAFSFWLAENRAHYTLLVCRCFQSSAFANSLTEDASDASFSAATPRGIVILASAIRFGSARAAARAAAAAAADTARAAARAARAVARAAAAAARAAAATDATDAADAAARAAAAAARAAAAIADAISTDIAQIQRPPCIGRRLRRADVEEDPVLLLAQPLWPEGTPAEVARLWIQLQRDLRGLDAGFEIWIDWYQDRLDGKPFDWGIEGQWALLSKEQLSQSPAEINAYLKGFRDGALTKELKRVRAIFIGHGEVGKTSLIRALHGEDVIQGAESMTQGVAIKDAMEEEAGVFTSLDFHGTELT